MSITSYLFNVRDFHMPRADAQPDPLGIRWHGQVSKAAGVWSRPSSTLTLWPAGS